MILDGEGIYVTVDRIDPRGGGVDSPLPGDVHIPCQVRKNTGISSSSSTDNFTTDIQVC